MVEKNSSLTQQMKAPEELRREIAILYELGLTEDEINFIKHLKKKHKTSSKWGD